MKTQKIYFDKDNIFVLLLAISFMAVLSYLCFNQSKEQWFLFFVGLAIGGIGLLTFFFALKILLPFKAAFIIDEEGIIDTSSAISLGRVRWDEIQQISAVHIKNVDPNMDTNGVNMIQILLHDPKSFIKKFKNPLKKVFLWISTKTYKTPVLINVQFMDVEFNYLLKTLQDAKDAAPFENIAKHLIE